MFGLNKDKESKDKLKQNAKQKSKTIKSLNKKIKELEKSRDNWKNKANTLKGMNDILQNELKKND